MADEMTRPYTTCYLIAFTADGREVVDTYTRDGEIAERTQLLSWLRDCGLNFAQKLAEPVAETTKE